MSHRMQTLNSISRRATSVLIRELGVVDTIRFLNQFRAGEGDYTLERRKQFDGVGMDELIKTIDAERQPD